MYEVKIELTNRDTGRVLATYPLPKAEAPAPTWTPEQVALLDALYKGRGAVFRALHLSLALHEWAHGQPRSATLTAGAMREQLETWGISGYLPPIADALAALRKAGFDDPGFATAANPRPRLVTGAPPPTPISWKVTMNGRPSTAYVIRHTAEVDFTKACADLRMKNEPGTVALSANEGGVWREVSTYQLAQVKEPTPKPKGELTNMEITNIQRMLVAVLSLLAWCRPGAASTHRVIARVLDDAGATSERIHTLIERLADVAEGKQAPKVEPEPKAQAQVQAPGTEAQARVQAPTCRFVGAVWHRPEGWKA